MSDDHKLEQTLIATLVADPSVFPKMREVVRPEYFGNLRFRRIYEASCKIAEASQDVSLVSLMASGVTSADLDGLLFGANPSEAGVLARAVAEGYLRRTLRDACMGIAQQLEGGGDPGKALEEFEKLLALGGRVFLARTPGLSDQVAAFAILIDRVHAGEELSAPTGLPCFDRRIGGIPYGDLTVLGGAPGLGKTSLTLNLVWSMLQAGLTVAFIEAEMAGEQILLWLNAIHAGAGSGAILEGSSYQQLTDPFLNWLREKPLHLFEPRERSLSELLRLLRLAHERGARVIVVDFLQCFRDRAKGVAEHEEVGRIAGAMRQFALTHRVAILALSSLNRDSLREGVPTLYSYRGSAEIEFNAALALQLWHDPDSGDDHERFRRVELRVCKNRNGSLGKLPLVFDGLTHRFREEMGSLEMEGPQFSEVSHVGSEH